MPAIAVVIISAPATMMALSCSGRAPATTIDRADQAIASAAIR